MGKGEGPRCIWRELVSILGILIWGGGGLMMELGCSDGIYDLYL